MPNFQVRWVRRYYTTGVIVVEADNADEARHSVMDNLDEITSSMQPEDIHTYSDGDDVEVTGIWR